MCENHNPGRSFSIQQNLVQPHSQPDSSTDIELQTQQGKSVHSHIEILHLHKHSNPLINFCSLDSGIYCTHSPQMKINLPLHTYISDKLQEEEFSLPLPSPSNNSKEDFSCFQQT